MNELLFLFVVFIVVCYVEQRRVSIDCDSRRFNTAALVGIFSEKNPFTVLYSPHFFQHLENEHLSAVFQNIKRIGSERYYFCEPSVFFFSPLVVFPQRTTIERFGKSRVPSKAACGRRFQILPMLQALVSLLVESCSQRRSDGSHVSMCDKIESHDIFFVVFYLVPFETCRLAWRALRLQDFMPNTDLLKNSLVRPMGTKHGPIPWASYWLSGKNQE